jgi:formylglycine-generating enzyme required for sulfatase activity
VFAWGDAPDPAMANYAATGISDTSAVGRFSANDYAAFDMIGNLWEWTRSVYRPNPYHASGEGPLPREKRMCAILGASRCMQGETMVKQEMPIFTRTFDLLT